MQVDGLQLSSGSRGVNNGLWGVWLKNGADNLIRNFNAGSRLVRDIAVQGLQPGTVISNSECSRCRARVDNAVTAAPGRRACGT